MEQHTPLQGELAREHSAMPAATLAIDAKKVPSALLARLISEVKTEAQSTVLAYNRTHNRHNRGR